MAVPPPASVGDPLDWVDTPALILDLDAFERNIERMAQAVGASGIRLRPHAKTHKCPEIARRQVAAGAIGVCAQKVSEAEALVDGGVDDVFVSNEIVGARKLERLARLARRARVSVCVDDPQNVIDLDQAAAAAGARLDVLVEVNVGGDRCGVEPCEPVVRLASDVKAAGHLRFAGIQAYHGHAQHLRSVDARRSAIEDAIERVHQTRNALERNGIDCPTVTGAGTGTYPFEMRSGVYNELQPGSYVFMDADYLRNDWSGFLRFEQSLFVLSTVMSRAAPGRAVLDAGMKALSVDSGMPMIAGWPGVTYLQASDEHGQLAIEPEVAGPKLGEKLMLIPGHCDPTVNMHDWYVCVRGGVVEALWPVSARGSGS
jgi:3-hydroxy-D-aspartate aldolase